MVAIYIYLALSCFGKGKLKASWRELELKKLFIRKVARVILLYIVICCEMLLGSLSLTTTQYVSINSTSQIDFEKKKKHVSKYWQVESMANHILEIETEGLKIENFIQNAYRLNTKFGSSESDFRLNCDI